jgi:hypothetical protein
MSANKILSCVTIASIVFFSGYSCDQGPNNPPADTGLVFSLLTQDVQTVSAGEAASFEVTVKNGNTSVVTVVCVRKSNELPDSSWVSSLCAGGNCFPAVVDTVSSNIGPGRTDQFIVDVFTGTAAGTARVGIEIYNQADSAERYERTFSCTVGLE